MAVCISCMTLPYYRHLRYLCIQKWRSLSPSQGLKRAMWKKTPFIGYAVSLLVAVAAPTAILGFIVAPQASKGFQQLKSMHVGETIKHLMPEHITNFVNTFLPSLNDYPGLQSIVNDIATNAEEYFTTFLSNIFTPSALWQRSVSLLGGSFTVLWIFFLFFTLTFLFTLYAKQARTITISLLPLPIPVITRFITAIRKALAAIFLGIIVVALIQGCLCGIAFWFVGIESSAFFGLLAAIVAPIPMIGTMLIWGPLSILLWLKGSHFAAVGLVVWGVVVVSSVDNICRPLFLQQGIKAPFFVLILSIICGTSVFGPLGVIAGPVLIAFSLQLIEESHNTLAEKNHTRWFFQNDENKKRKKVRFALKNHPCD